MPLKRALDLVLATVLSLATLPVVLLLGIVLAVHLRAWPLFVHDRIGRDHRPLRMVKLRTLPTTTPSYALKTDVPLETSALCRVVRRLHLDELPQLWLVVRGSLSLVGPRPKMPDEAEPVDPRYGAERVTVPQGVTGLWQVSNATGGLPSDAPHFDVHYVRNRTTRLDLWIMWRTLGKVLGLARGVDVRDVPNWALPRHARRRTRRVVLAPDLTPTSATGRRALEVARHGARRGLDVELRAPVPRTADGRYLRGYGRFTRRDMVDGIPVRRCTTRIAGGDGLVARLRRTRFVLRNVLGLLPALLDDRVELVVVSAPSAAPVPVARPVVGRTRTIILPEARTPAAASERA